MLLIFATILIQLSEERDAADGLSSLEHDQVLSILLRNGLKGFLAF